MNIDEESLWNCGPAVWQWQCELL